MQRLTAWLTFFVGVTYFPLISGAATAPRWALLSIALPVMLLAFLPYSRDEHSSVSDVTNFNPFLGHHLAGGLFLLYATISMLWVEVWQDALDALWKFYLLAMAFAIGSRLNDIRHIYIAFGYAITTNSVVMITQVWGLWPFGGAGLFFNPNFAGEAAALAIIGCLICRRYLLAAFCWPSVVLSGSRGALLALAIVGVVWLWQHKRQYAVIAGSIILVCSPLIQFVGKGGASITQRLDLWTDVVQGLTLFGHGVGSFGVMFPKFATHVDTLATHFDHAHNDALEIIYEFGFIGAVLVGTLVFAAMRAAREAECLILCTFIVCGFAGFSLFEPVTAFIALLVAGHTCGHGASLRAPVDASRVELLRTRPTATKFQNDGVKFAARG